MMLTSIVILNVHFECIRLRKEEKNKVTRQSPLYFRCCGSAFFNTQQYHSSKISLRKKFLMYDISITNCQWDSFYLFYCFYLKRTRKFDQKVSKEVYSNSLDMIDKKTDKIISNGVVQLPVHESRCKLAKVWIAN